MISLSLSLCVWVLRQGRMFSWYEGKVFLFRHLLRFAEIAERLIFSGHLKKKKNIKFLSFKNTKKVINSEL